MSENRVDPSGNTEQFQAFVESAEPAPQKSRLPLILGGVAVIAVAIVVILLVVLT